MVKPESTMLHTCAQSTVSVILAIALFISVFTVYCLTLAPGLVFIDSGELAAVCSTLGIAHPTGYPLYTLMGWLVTRIPVAVRQVTLLNLLSALCTTLGAVFVFWGIRELSSSSVKHFAGGNLSPPLRIGICITGSILWAFCSVVWSSAVVTEVYALHGMFMALIMFLSIRLLQKNSLATCQRTSLYPLIVLFSLSLSNHLSTVLVLPSLIYCVFSRRDLIHLLRQQWLRCVGLVLLGLLPYIYLPLRARQFPALNWGNPQTLENFLWHVTGRQYRVWMFSSFETILRQTAYFCKLVAASFGYLPLLLVPMGLWFLFCRQRRIFFFSFIVFAADFIYAVNYDIHDIDPYFLPALLMCCLWMSAGLLFCCEYFKAVTTKKILIPLLCAVTATPLVLNYNSSDQSKNNLVEQYTESVLQCLEKNALIFSYQWDYFCSPLSYLQLVEKKRTDVIMIEVLLLKRSWYLTQLQKNYPDLMAPLSREIEQYETELYKFEHNLPYDSAIIQRAYLNLINSMITTALPERPVYVTCEIEQGIGAGLQRIPEGLVFRLYPDSIGYRSFDTEALRLPPPDKFKKTDRYHTTLKSFYGIMLASRGLYELYYHHHDLAASLIQKAAALSPDNGVVQRALAALHHAAADGQVPLPLP